MNNLFRPDASNLFGAVHIGNQYARMRPRTLRAIGMTYPRC